MSSVSQEHENDLISNFDPTPCHQCHFPPQIAGLNPLLVVKIPTFWTHPIIEEVQPLILLEASITLPVDLSIQSQIGFNLFGNVRGESLIRDCILLSCHSWLIHHHRLIRIWLRILYYCILVLLLLLLTLRIFLIT